MTPLTSPSWDRKTGDSQNQDSKARGISEFHQQPELVPRSHHNNNTIRGIDTTCLQPDSQTCKKLLLAKHRRTLDSHQPPEKELTKDHQSTQEALMFTPQRTRNTTLRQPATKKTLPQAFLPDPRSGGPNQAALALQLTTATTVTFLRLHKQHTPKLVISKAAFQASWTEGATVPFPKPTTTVMSQLPTDQDSATGNKWKALG